MSPTSQDPTPFADSSRTLPNSQNSNSSGVIVSLECFFCQYYQSYFIKIYTGSGTTNLGEVVFCWDWLGCSFRPIYWGLIFILRATGSWWWSMSSTEKDLWRCWSVEISTWPTLTRNGSNTDRIMLYILLIWLTTAKNTYYTLKISKLGLLSQKYANI